MFLVCGEALLDVFVTEERADGVQMDARPGGSPFNVAVGLARLGQGVALFTGLSTDYFGGRLRAFLVREGVDISPCPSKADPTSLAVVSLDAHGVARYSFNGGRTADRLLTLEDLPEPDARVRAVHMGSIATAVEPVAGTLKALARRESGRRFLSFDPNVRPTVEPDMAVWRRTLDDLLPHVTLLKISREDFDLLFPGCDPAEAARAWLDPGRDGAGAGPALVVVTDGENDAIAWTATQTFAVPCAPGPLVDTVGAGDTFQAGLLCALAERDALTPAALRALPEADVAAVLGFAARAAAITCSRRGADLPRRADVGA